MFTASFMKVRYMRYILPVVLVIAIIVAGGALFFLERSPGHSQVPRAYTYKVVATYPHDPYAFTEGLDYLDNTFVESTGPGGNSTIRLVNLTTGGIMREHHLPGPVFAEGATILGDRIVQQTETSGYGFLYSLNDLGPLGTFRYSTNGWGITDDEEHLIMSDGTSTLYFLDPVTFRYVRNITVTSEGKPVQNINELEYVNGEIYANIWPTYKIAIISPETGQVTGWIDLTGILSPEDTAQVGWSSIESLRGHTSIPFNQEDSPNGIAYDPSEDRLFVTGKLWPKIYQVELVRVR